MNAPDLLCIAVYALTILLGLIQIIKLVEYQLEKLRRHGD